MINARRVLTVLAPPDGGTMPRRMEPRSAFTAYFSVDDTGKLPSLDVTRAYANTDSGEVAYSRGSSWRASLSLRSSIQVFGRPSMSAWDRRRILAR